MKVAVGWEDVREEEMRVNWQKLREEAYRVKYKRELIKIVIQTYIKGHSSFVTHEYLRP